MPESTVQEILERRERTKSPEHTGLGSGLAIDRQDQYAGALKLLADMEAKYATPAFVGQEDWSMGGKKYAASDLVMGSQGFLVHKPIANHFNYLGPDEKAEQAKEIGKAIHHALRNHDQEALERAIQKFSRLDDLVDREFAGKRMLQGIYLELVGKNDPLVTQSLEQMSTTELLERLSGQLTAAKDAGKTLIGLDLEKVRVAVENARKNKDTPMGEALNGILQDTAAKNKLKAAPDYDKLIAEVRAQLRDPKPGEEVQKLLTTLKDVVQRGKFTEFAARFKSAHEAELNSILRELELQDLPSKRDLVAARESASKATEARAKADDQWQKIYIQSKEGTDPEYKKQLTELEQNKKNAAEKEHKAQDELRIKTIAREQDLMARAIKRELEYYQDLPSNREFKAAQEAAAKTSAARKDADDAWLTNFEVSKKGTDPRFKELLEELKRNKQVAAAVDGLAQNQLKLKTEAREQDLMTRALAQLHVPYGNLDTVIEHRLGFSAANALRQVTNVIAPSIDATILSRQFEDLLSAARSPKNTEDLKKFLQHNRGQNISIILATIEETSPKAFKEFDQKLKDKFLDADYRAAKEIMRPGGEDLWEKTKILVENPLTQAATLRKLSVEQNLIVRDLYAASDLAHIKGQEDLASFLTGNFTKDLQAKNLEVVKANQQMVNLVITGRVHTPEFKAVTNALVQASIKLAATAQNRQQTMGGYYKPEATKLAKVLSAGKAGEEQALTDAVLAEIEPLKGDAVFIENAYNNLGSSTFKADVVAKLGDTTAAQMINLLALNNLHPNSANDLAAEILGEKEKFPLAIQRLLKLDSKARRSLLDATELTIDGSDSIITLVSRRRDAGDISTEAADSFFAAMHGLNANTAAKEINAAVKDAVNVKSTKNAVEYTDYLVNTLHPVLAKHLPLDAMILEEDLAALGSNPGDPSEEHLRQIEFAMDAQKRIVMAQNPELQDQLLGDFAAISVDLERTISSQAANVWFHWENILGRSGMDIASRTAGSEAAAISFGDQQELVQALENYLDEAPASAILETQKSLEKVYSSHGLDLRASIDAHFTDMDLQDRIKLVLNLRK